MGLASVRKQIPYLQQLKRRNLTRRQRQHLLEAGGDPLIKCLQECCHNVLRGAVQLSEPTRRRLKRHARNIREVADPRGSIKRKKQLLVQRGGFLPALLVPIISAVTGLVSGLVGGR